jgi:hypothetical protein
MRLCIAAPSTEGFSLRALVTRTTAGFLALLALGLGPLSGCRERPGPEPAVRAHSRSSRIDPAALGKDRSQTLRALSMSTHEVLARLGSFRATARSKLVTRVPGTDEKIVEQDLLLRVDAKKGFQLVKNTHPQYGAEVAFVDGVLYPRLRFGKFLRRSPRAGEPEEILDRMGGVLPASLELLERFVRIVPGAAAERAGRSGVGVSLELEPHPASPPSQLAPAREWRRTISVKSLAGSALLDAKTGAPLEAKLKARWTFSPPAAGSLPPSGIPKLIDRGATGTMELDLDLVVEEVGGVAPVRPPPDGETIDNPRRLRLEIERRMLTGELPLEAETRSEP